MKSFIYWVSIVSLSLLFFSCKDNKFKIKGEIYGAQDKSLVIEKNNFQGRWMPVDSVKINKNGGFSFTFPAPASPEIFRLSLNNQFIYIPVDSTETITITSSLDKFGTDFNLEGSNNAMRLANFERELQKAPISDLDSLDMFKRNVYSNYMKDAPGSIVSFYILTKTINDRPLYNLAEPGDRKYFAAVATGFKSTRPNDPHTALLEETALLAMKQKNSEAGKFKTIEADELSLIDMDLQDDNGKNVRLSDIVNKGKKVVVIFSLLNHPDAPAFNLALAKIYQRLNGKVEFYNVSLDEDQYAWREAAKNLPWITVYSPGQTASQDARNYNVFQIPSFFIYNSEGELVKRPLTIEELNEEL